MRENVAGVLNISLAKSRWTLCFMLYYWVLDSILLSRWRYVLC